MAKVTETDLDARLAEWSEYYTESLQSDEPLEERQVAPTRGELLLLAVVLVVGTAIAIAGIGTIAGYLWHRVFA